MENSSSFQQWQNFANRLRFEKVIAKSLVAWLPFFGTQCTTDRWICDKELPSSAMDQPRRPASSLACSCSSLYVSSPAEQSSIITLTHNTHITLSSAPRHTTDIMISQPASTDCTALSANYIRPSGFLCWWPRRSGTHYRLSFHNLSVRSCSCCI